MIKNTIYLLPVACCLLLMSSCGSHTQTTDKKDTLNSKELTDMQKKLAKYVKVKLTADISGLTENEKKVLPLLFDAAQIMDDIYWEENFGNKDEFLNSITDEATKQFALINYGPWDRIDGNKPFIASYGEKPKGANFYPKDMTKAEFDNLNDKEKDSEFSLIRIGDKGELKAIPYHVAFKDKTEKAVAIIKQAAELAENPGLKKYLKLRAEALLTDNYYDSDIAWMDMKNSNIDFVVGPIEDYDDGLNGLKTSHEAFVLIKDPEWSKKLSKYTAMLPQFQRDLPVESKYKKEVPGTDADINAYDAVYYQGNCNAGSKTIAINLPNDEKVQLKKGTRKFQLKNSMKAKFDNILVPIANLVIAENQRKYIKFNAFFENTMFHEVSHGIGIKNTIDGKGTVRKAMKEVFSAYEEGKADILGLYLVTKLYEKGELKDGEVMDNYVTFIAGIIRSVRFGASEAHGKANMQCFNFMEENGAFTRSNEGIYTVNFDKMKIAVTKLVQNILKIQGDGDYDLAKTNLEKNGVINPQLQDDLHRIEKANIPVDIVFEQGKENFQF